MNAELPQSTEDAERCGTMSMQDKLEALVDSHGLYNVANVLARICHAKAEHLAHNWQDQRSARNWDKAGDACSMLWKRLRKISDGSF